jgi:hypothetical protein
MLNKLRRAEKQSISLLPSPEPGARLGDAGASYFSISETVAFSCVSDLCLLFEFLM